jgi:ABC-2 type transport system ATP-binding protein
MATSAVEIRGLTRRFGKLFTLGPIDLTVPAGTIYGFVGPNGAGKTTTLDLIFGLGGKDGGSIEVMGLDHIRDDVAMKRAAGYVSPDLNYQAWTRVDKAIRFVSGFYPTWDDEYCQTLLKAFHLNWRDQIGALSFGAKTKLSLLLAMSWQPKVLVLDEPTIGLDAISKQQVFAELLGMVRDGERSVLISSHNLSDIERITDHVGMIKSGQMIFEGATTDVVERFRMIDIDATHAAALADQAGITVQETEGLRGRVLVDQRQVTIDHLRARGVTVLSDCPVTLEELFVALGRA